MLAWWWCIGGCWVGVGSGRCDEALGGKEGIGLDEKPGPLTLMDGAAVLEGLEGDSKLMTGAAAEEGRMGGWVMLGDGFMDGILDGCPMLMIGALWKPGTMDAASGSSANTGLGVPGSSGRQMVGMGGIGEVGRPGELPVGVGEYGPRCPLSRGGSILGMA